MGRLFKLTLGFLSVLVFLSLFGLLTPDEIKAGYDCPGNVSPPASGIYTRYCTDGNSDTNDTGRLIKISVARGPRVYPGETLRFFAKVFDYNETCSTNSCLKDVLTTVDLVRNLGTTNYNFGSTPTVTFKIFDPSGTTYTEVSSGAGGDWSAHGTTSQSVTTNTSPPTFTFSGTNYGTWWIYAVDDSTGDYTWFPLYYSAALDTTATSFYGYTVPKWISDLYENNVEFLQNLQITDGPSKGLFHDSRVEPRITDLGSASGAVKQYLAYEDTMQTGFAMKAMYDLWKVTRDSRLATMIQYVIDNVYTQFQGDYSGANTDPKLNAGSDGAWVQGNYNDDKAVYAYSKAYTAAPYANAEYWISSSAVGGAWAATGWADLGASNASSGDQDIGQLIGVYYAWKYLNETDPDSADIDYLENAVEAGSALTGGKSGGWVQWTNTTASNRGTALNYIILNKMVGLADYFTGNDKIIDNYLSNSAATGYGSTAIQKIILGTSSNGDITFDDDAHHIFFNGIALEINGETDQVVSDDYNITDLKSRLNSQVETISRSFSADTDFFTTENIPFNKLYYRTSENDFYLNSSTADATISSSYTDLYPYGEYFYAYGVTNSAPTTDYNYNALYDLAKRSSYDDDFNFLPLPGLSYEGIYTGTFFLRPPLMTEYKLRFVAGAMQQLAYYIRDHEVNAQKNDIDFSNTTVDLLNKEWNVDTNDLSFKTWDNGTISLSYENKRAGYIYEVSEGGSLSNKTLTVNTSGVPSFTATKDITYTVDNDCNLSVVPGGGDVDVSVTSCSTNTISWTESSGVSNNTTTNRIEGLTAFGVYTVYVDGNVYALLTASSGGVASFNYAGGFSSHTFDFQPTVSSSSTSSAPVCTDKIYSGKVNFFKVARNKENARIYFIPSEYGLKRYNVLYGFYQGDARFGAIGFPAEVATDFTGAYTIDILNINKNTTYWFKITPVLGCAVGEWSDWVESKPGQGGGTVTVSKISPKKNPLELVVSTSTPAPVATPPPKIILTPVPNVVITKQVEDKNAVEKIIDSVISFFQKII